MIEKEPKNESADADEDTVQGELYIERMPEIFNPRAYYKKGVAVFLRRNQKLEVGLPGMTVNFGKQELEIFYRSLKMWDALGRPESGEIYNEGKSISLSEFTDSLYGDERKFRTGKNYRRRVERWLKNLLMIPMAHTMLSKDADGNDHFVLKSFTFLSSLEGDIFKKKGRYFDLSKITLHPHIVRNLLAHNMKPVRLDVIRKLGENEILFYRELDLLLSKRRSEERPLKKFCNDLRIMYKNERDYAAKARKICSEIDGKPLSSGGLLSVCVKEINGENWLVAYKVPEEKRVRRISQNESKTIQPKPVVPQDQEFAERRDFLLRHHEQFSKAEKDRVTELQKNLLKEAPYSQSSFTIEDCFLKSIESVLKQEIAKERIFNPSGQCETIGRGRNVMREPVPFKNRFLTQKEIDAHKTAARDLCRVLLSIREMAL